MLTWTENSSVNKTIVKKNHNTKLLQTMCVQPYLKFIHHLANATSFLSNDVTMKLKRHFNLNGYRNQSLKKKKEKRI